MLYPYSVYHIYGGLQNRAESEMYVSQPHGQAFLALRKYSVHPDFKIDIDTDKKIENHVKLLVLNYGMPIPDINVELFTIS